MLIFHPAYIKHEQSPYHVESPARLQAITAAMRTLGYMDDALEPKTATVDDVLKVHKKEFVEYLRDYGEGPLDPDTTLHPGTFGIALLAVGGAMLAAEKAVQERKGHIALVRPPGHHAGPDYCGGFCYMNNIAVAAAKLLEKQDRVAILDFDAHHGNGTSDIFVAEPRVLYVSTHQYRIFPGTGPAEAVGEGKGRGFNVNIPFVGGCGDTSFEFAMSEVVEPIVKQFKPQAILVSLGVDAHYMDPLTALALSSKGYVELMDSTIRLAKETCSGRLAITLEGGYHPPALAEVFAATEGLIRGDSVSVELNENRDPGCLGRKIIQHVRKIQGEFWDL